jgi:hypothetical protein
MQNTAYAETTGHLLGQIMVHEPTHTVGLVIGEENPSNIFADMGVILKTAEGEAVEFKFADLREASNNERATFPQQWL